jgi:hypothetical protein
MSITYKYKLEQINQLNVADIFKKHLNTNLLRMSFVRGGHGTIELVENELNLLNERVDCKKQERWARYSLNVLINAVLYQVHPLHAVKNYGMTRQDMIMRIQNLNNFCFNYISILEFKQCVIKDNSFIKQDIFDLYFGYSKTEYKSKFNVINLDWRIIKKMINKLKLFVVLLSTNGRVGKKSSVRMLNVNQYRLLFDYL